ncbi:hypothetical protein D3C84_884890 [compost metagenome]
MTQARIFHLGDHPDACTVTEQPLRQTLALLSGKAPDSPEIDKAIDQIVSAPGEMLQLGVFTVQYRPDQQQPRPREVSRRTMAIDLRNFYTDAEHLIKQVPADADPLALSQLGEALRSLTLTYLENLLRSPQAGG